MIDHPLDGVVESMYPEPGELSKISERDLCNIFMCNPNPRIHEAVEAEIKRRIAKRKEKADE